MRRALSLLISALALVLVLTFSGQALAFNIFTQGSSVDCGKNSQASTSAVCSESSTTSDPITGSHGYLAGITDIVAIVAGIAAVIIIIVSGIRYITSVGDATKVNNAKNTLIYAIVGLVVIVLARTLIVYVVSKL